MGANTIDAGPNPDRNENAAIIMDAIRRIVRSLRVSTRSVERGIGISGAQLFVLQQLAERPAHSVNELAMLTMTHQSSVSAVVTRLADQGLVKRKTAKEDARRTLIELTAKGRRLLAAAPVTPQARLIESLRQLPDEQLKFLASTIGEWIARAGIDEEPAQFFFEDDASAGGTNG